MSDETPNRVLDHKSESLAKANARMEIVGPAGYYYRESVSDYVDLGEFEEPDDYTCICGSEFEYEGELWQHLRSGEHT